jgi:hypothetical protein
MASFMRVFTSVLHALEAAATIAGPIVKAVDPEIGLLMSQATNTAVLIESIIPDAKKGQVKADIVDQTTQAALDLTNSLLTSQGKQPLNAAIKDAATATAKTVVDTLNVVANTVQPAPAA